MLKKRKMFSYEKAGRSWVLYCFRRRWLQAFRNIYIFINLGCFWNIQAFWNIYVFINLCILSKNICWPTKCFPDCFLKRTISEHNPCSPEIVLLFQKMSSIRSDHPFSMVLLSRCAWNFFLSSSFKKKGLFSKSGFT